MKRNEHHRAVPKWRCLARFECREMGDTVSLQCQRHFRHGHATKSAQVSHHASSVAGIKGVFRWVGDGVGTKEQGDSWLEWIRECREMGINPSIGK